MKMDQFKAQILQFSYLLATALNFSRKKKMHLEDKLN